MSTDVSAEKPVAAGGVSRAWGSVSHYLNRAGILIPFLLLFLVLSLTSEPFATKANLLLILEQQSSASSSSP